MVITLWSRFYNSNELKYQKARFETYLMSIKKALLKLKIIMMHDMNIDISHNNNHNIKYNIKPLYELYHKW